MEKFNWREANARALNRYDGLPEAEPWRRLVERISSPAPESRDGARTFYADAFADFVAALDRDSPPIPTIAGTKKGPAQPTCCLFVSHRMKDVDNALHIAWRATQAGYDYWLDIHDPTLIALTGAAIPSPAKDILLAATIEIALLNSTHVIALHTQYSIGTGPNNLSKWIPYELGRAKTRQIRSNQSACWFDKHTPISTCGEYVYLVEQTWTKGDIDGWLAKAQQGHCVLTTNKTWKHATPPPPLDQ
jgi:hypothetical protein